MAIVAEHLTLKCEWLGERKGVLEMRRMYGGYFKGFRGASRLRTLMMDESTREGALSVLLNFSEDDLQQAAQVRVPRAIARAKLPIPTRRQEAVGA